MIDKPHQVHNHPADEIARERNRPLGSTGAKCAEAQEPPDTGVKQENLSLNESIVSQSDDHNSKIAKPLPLTDDMPPSSCHEAETEFQEGVKFASYRKFQEALREYEGKSNFKFVCKTSTDNHEDDQWDNDKIVPSAPKREVNLVCQFGEDLGEERNMTSSWERCPVSISLRVGRQNNWKKSQYVMTHFNKTEHNHPPMSTKKSSSEKINELFDEESDLLKTEHCDEDWKPDEEVDLNTSGNWSSQPEYATSDDYHEPKLEQGQNFTSFQHFLKAIRVYEEKSNYKLVTRSTHKNKLSDEERDFPKERVKMVCHQSIYRTNTKQSKNHCPVILSLRLQRPKDATLGSTPWYTIDRFNKSEHNHSLVSRGSNSPRMDKEEVEDSANASEEGDDNCEPHEDMSSSKKRAKLRFEESNVLKKGDGEVGRKPDNHLNTGDNMLSKPKNAGSYDHQGAILEQGQNFSSFQQFHEAIKVYEEKSNYRLVTRSTHKNMLPDEERHFPKRKVKMICHMGSYGKNAMELKNPCPVILLLSLQRPKDATSETTPWYTIIRFNQSEHNHPPLDPEPPKAANAPKEEEPLKLCDICGFAGKNRKAWDLKAHMENMHELKYCPVSILLYLMNKKSHMVFILNHDSYAFKIQRIRHSAGR